MGESREYLHGWRRFLAIPVCVYSTLVRCPGVCRVVGSRRKGREVETYRNNHIRADGGAEDGGQRVGAARGRTILADDADGRRGHCEGRICVDTDD